MIKRTFYIFLGILVLFQTACDKVVEKPMEEQFPKIELKEINQPTDSTTGIAFLDVVSENGIVESVNVSFSKPQKGTIEADPLHHRFIYHAYPEEFGVDSFNYTISRQSLSKTGTIRLDVRTPQCEPKASGNIDYNIGPQTIDSNLFIPFDTRDAYCKSRIVRITDDAPTFRIVRQVENGFYVEPNGLLATGGNFSINYSVNHNRYNPIFKLVKFSLNFTSNYCDKVFKVRNLPYPLRAFGPNPQHTHIDRKMLINMVQSCPNEVVPMNNWFVKVDNIQFNYELDSTRVKIMKPAGPGPKEVKFGFRFKNARGVIGTGYGSIKF